MKRRLSDDDRARAEEAVDLYKEFHRYDPRKIGAFEPSFQIPAKVYLAGPAVNVMYRSAKVDPSTLRKPRSPVNYIHDHDPGVKTYLVNKAYSTGESANVPERFRKVDALARLGLCLGYTFKMAGGVECEAQGTQPMPDLYATPDGDCLIVVQSRRKVIAMMWGGNLGVYARGIDG